MEEKIFQVSEFNEFISLYLNQAGPLTIEGEISQIKISQNKWLFITIKDDKASVDIFGTVFKTPSYDIFETGMLVHIVGSPNLYQKTGRFSVNAEQILPAGKGAIELAFQKLKEKLTKEGLFAEERKRPIPEYPEKIGLITAKGSQAYNDFIKVVKHRMGGLEIYFIPTSVQGNQSPKEIINSISHANNELSDLDVLVLTRGGGSLEDLQSFNDESVVRAIYGSKIPVVCGVGHEGDISLSDLVADLRASTPSNAAELIVKDRNYLLTNLESTVQNLFSLIQNEIRNLNNKTSEYSNILHKSLVQQMSNFKHLIQKVRNNMNRAQEKLKTEINLIDPKVNHLNYLLLNLVKVKKQQLIFSEKLLKTNDYNNILKRGYSISRSKNGKILKSKKDVKKGDEIITELTDGKISSNVID